MYSFLLLMKIRLNQMFELSATFQQKDMTKKVYTLVHRLIALGIYAGLFYLIYMVASYLAASGLVKVLPIIGYFGAVILTFLVTMLKINETFTGNEDSEFLLSMPFSSATQVFVMFVLMYVRNLFCCILVELPLYLVYKQSVTDFPVGAWVFGLLLTSLPVCGIAVLLGMVVILSLVHSPKKNQIVSGIVLVLIVIAVTLLLVVGDRIYYVAIGRIQYEAQSVAEGLLKEVIRNFRLGRFYQLGIVEGDLTYKILYTFMSLIWYMVFLFMHTMAYRTVITALRSPISYGVADREKIAEKMVESQTHKAILHKEIAQFVRSKSYMLQSAIGIILGIALPLNFVIIGTKSLMKYSVVVPVALCICVGVSCTSYCAMSMEGKRHWIMETSPMSRRELIRAKLAVNLLCTLTMAILGGVLCGVAFPSSPAWKVLYVIIPVIYTFINAGFGSWIGTRYADYKNESEDMIMHRGIPFLLGYLPGVLVPALTLFLLIRVI